MSDPPEHGRPTRRPKPVHRLRVLEGWHGEIGPHGNDPLEQRDVCDRDATWAPPKPIPAVRPDPSEPARPARRSGAVQGEASPPRHNLLGNQDVQTSPGKKDPETRNNMPEHPPCTHCTGTDHAAESCDTGRLVCSTCGSRGHVAGTCGHICQICQRRGHHVEMNCPYRLSPLVGTSPTHSQHSPRRHHGQGSRTVPETIT